MQKVSEFLDYILELIIQGSWSYFKDSRNSLEN